MLLKTINHRYSLDNKKKALFYHLVDDIYYKKARKWYNDIYVKSASERISYLIIVIISAICLYQAYNLISIVKQNKKKINTYIIFTKSKKQNEYTKIKTIETNTKDVTLAILDILITKYVLNMETLVYDKNTENATQQIEKKTIVIKNLSNNEVYENYIKNSYNNEDSDLSLIVLKEQKIAKIDKIDYIYDNLNIFDKIYNCLASYCQPIGANVYFTTQTTINNSKKKHYMARIFFTLNKINNKINSKIDFNITHYSVKEIKNVED